MPTDNHDHFLRMIQEPFLTARVDIEEEDENAIRGFHRVHNTVITQDAHNTVFADTTPFTTNNFYTTVDRPVWDERFMINRDDVAVDFNLPAHIDFDSVITLNDELDINDELNITTDELTQFLKGEYPVEDIVS